MATLVVFLAALGISAKPANAALGTIIGKVYDDTSGNGVMDGGESGHDAVVVILDANANGVLDPTEQSTTTNVAGTFSFSGLAAGTYQVRALVPSGYGVTSSNPVQSILSSGGTNNNVNVGISNVGLISGTVYEDEDGDGTKDVSETAMLPGRTAFLDTNNNGTRDTGEKYTTTDVSGRYAFAGLVAGTYRPRVTVPSGSQQTSTTPSPVVLATNGTATGNDFGLFTQVSISGTVWNDINGNGSREISDTGVSSRTVYLDIDGNDTKDTGEPSAVTVSNGSYSITGVGPGTFRVRLVEGPTFMQTTLDPVDVVGSSGLAVVGYDFGTFTFATISGTVYTDLDADGTKDTGETGQSGRTAYLDTNDDGDHDPGEVTAVTGGTGVFTFSGMAPGTYRVRLVLPAGLIQTSSDPSDVTVTSAMSSTTNHIGLFTPAVISGTVYNDSNGNGTMTAGETGISGVTAYIDANGNSSLDPTETTTTSNGSGVINFTDLPPGTYRIRIVLSPGQTQTSLNPAPVTPTSGASVTTANFGVFTQAVISGEVFDDFDGNGIYDDSENGIQGRTVFLDANANAVFDVGESSIVTGPSGSYTFSGVALGTYRPRVVLPVGYSQTTAVSSPIAVTSGLVATDRNIGLFTSGSMTGSVYADLNGNGTRQLGENGISGKTAFLDSDADGVLDATEQSTSTDGSGNYTFAGLGPGTYRVRVVVGVGSVQTSASPAAMPTTSGTALTGVDFGIFAQATISGTVYNDLAGNGVRNAGDLGVTGKTLFLDLNGNNVFDSGEVSVTSGLGGAFTFTGLNPGTYTPTIVVPTGSLRTSPMVAPITVTSGSSSGNNDIGLFTFGTISGTVFNDINGNGTKDATDNGIIGKTVYIDADADSNYDSGEVSAVTNNSGVFSISGLLSGSYTVRLVQSTGTTQTSADPPLVLVQSGSTASAFFGIYGHSVINGQIYNDVVGNGTKNIPPDTGVLGATAYLDLNGNSAFDSTEPTAVTDAAGNYTFTGLLAGSYKVRMVTPTGSIQTSTALNPVTTSSNSVSNGNDMGLFRQGVFNGVVFDDLNGNGSPDTGELGLSNVRVYSDNNSNGTWASGEQFVFTDSVGAFSIGGFNAVTVRIRAVLPSGTALSTPLPTATTVSSGLVANGVNFGVFTPGIVSGTVYTDTNRNGTKETSEAGSSGRTVYVDTNNNGAKDTGEPSATTSASGGYTIGSLMAGSHYVRAIAPTGLVQTSTNPSALVVTSGSTFTAVNFGFNTSTSSSNPTPPTTTPPSGPSPTPTPTPDPTKPSEPTDSMSVNTGYWMASAEGGVFSYGSAGFFGSAVPFRPTDPIVGMAPTSDGAGYWLVARDGGIFAFGNAQFYGSMGGKSINKPMVGMAATPQGAGYWTVASDGGVFSYGDAKFYGSTGSIKLNSPIVQILPTSTGAGYWLVAADGGIFAYGDAQFYGSTGSIRLNQPIVGMARAAGSAGYWLVARDGGIFAFGNAQFYGSMGGVQINQPIVSIRAMSDGSGYWMFARDGGVFSFGSARFFGSTPATKSPIVQ